MFPLCNAAQKQPHMSEICPVSLHFPPIPSVIFSDVQTKNLCDYALQLFLCISLRRGACKHCSAQPQRTLLKAEFMAACTVLAIAARNKPADVCITQHLNWFYSEFYW